MLKLSSLKIDPEFSAQILPLSFEELQQLEQNIIAEGRLLNPIITWNGYILDGHTLNHILKVYGVKIKAAQGSSGEWRNKTYWMLIKLN